VGYVYVRAIPTLGDGIIPVACGCISGILVLCLLGGICRIKMIRFLVWMDGL
jgi:hypothetical protein